MFELLLLVAVPSVGFDLEAEVQDTEAKPIMARNVATAIRLAEENPDATICARVKKGASRIKVEKVCMSSAGWRETEKQQIEMKRDLATRYGASG